MALKDLLSLIYSSFASASSPVLARFIVSVDRRYRNKRLELAAARRYVTRWRNVLWEIVMAVFRVSGARVEVPAAVWMCGLWLRLGFAGMLLAGYGLAAIVANGAVTLGLLIAAAGVVLSVIGFRLSWRAVSDADVPGVPGTISPRSSIRPASPGLSTTWG